MRLLLTVNFSPWSPYSGGGQWSTHNLACALAARGHAVTVVYTRALAERFGPSEPVPYTIVWAAFAGIRSRRQAPLRPLNALSVARSVSRLCSTERIDAVHGNGEEAAALGRLRDRHRFAFVVTPRFPDYPAPMLRRQGPTRLERVQLALGHAKYLALGRAVRAADWVCPTSASAASMVRRAYNISSERTRVIPNGVAQPFMEAHRAERVCDDAPLVFFGRLAEGKGVDTLLDALGQLRSTGAVVPRTLIIGRGDCRPALERQAEALGVATRVEFVDWMSPSSLAKHLAGAAAAVLPSREESFGNAAAEAMAAGCPIISTRVGAIGEFVDHGRTGTLVEPNQPAALGAAIAALMQNPADARAMAQAGRETIRSRYTWDAIAARFENCYEAQP